MVVWKTILYVICAIIGCIMIIFFLVPTVLGVLSSCKPTVSNVFKTIECHLLRDACFFISPSSPTENSKVTATILTQPRYDNQLACISEINRGVVDTFEESGKSCCTLTSDKFSTKCTTDFKAEDGIYYAFVDSAGNGFWNYGEARSKDEVTLAY